MKNQRNKPNFSMYLPPELRDKINGLIEEEEYSSVSAFLIAAAKFHYKFHFED